MLRLRGKDMVLIEWEPELTLSARTIDDDHHRLVELINGIYEQLVVDGRKQDVIDQFVALYCAAGKHFAYEEVLMQERSYDGHYVKHYADHQRLLNEVTNMMYRYQYGLLKDYGDITETLRDWFCDHFKNYDALFLKNKNSSQKAEFRQ